MFPTPLDAPTREIARGIKAYLGIAHVDARRRLELLHCPIDSLILFGASDAINILCKLHRLCLIAFQVRTSTSAGESRIILVIFMIIVPDYLRVQLSTYNADSRLKSLFTVRGKEALRKANITHVLSVLRLPLDQDLFKDYEHYVVELDDVEDENIIQHFKSSNEFIQKGLDGGGGVLVHW